MNKLISMLVLMMLSHGFLFAQNTNDYIQEQYKAADDAAERLDFQTALILYYELIPLVRVQDRFQLYLKTSFCHKRLNDFDRALEDIKKVLKVNKAHEQYKFLRGTGYWQMGGIYVSQAEYKKGIKYLEQANSYLNSTDLYSTIGYYQVVIEDYKNARGNLEIAISMDSTNAYAYNNLAMVYLNDGDLVRATSLVEKSLSLDDMNSYAYKHKALIHIEKKEFDLVCEDLQKSKALGYSDFTNDPNSNEVDQLIEKYCSNESNQF